MLLHVVRSATILSTVVHSTPASLNSFFQFRIRTVFCFFPVSLANYPAFPANPALLPSLSFHCSFSGHDRCVPDFSFQSVVSVLISISFLRFCMFFQRPASISTVVPCQLPRFVYSTLSIHLCSFLTS